MQTKAFGRQKNKMEQNPNSKEYVTNQTGWEKRNFFFFDILFW